MKYVILSDARNIAPFIIPRQLLEINGEKLVQRTIRLLKENGVKDILITSHDKRFDNLGAKRYEPLHNDYDGLHKTGYWLNAFPQELLIEPITFLFGDVYYSENAIKTIVETEADKSLFFCTYNNEDKRYIKHHDEPLGYKVIDYEEFKNSIEEVKRMYDKGLCRREPIVWELYRYINGQDVNKHIMTNNYVAINDESCDIDRVEDTTLLRMKLGGIKVIKAEATETFTLARFEELINIQRKSIDVKGKLFRGDVFECTEDMAEYLNGGNKYNKSVIRVLEVIPAKEETKPVEELVEPLEEEKLEEVVEEPVEAVKPKKTRKKTNK